MSAHRTIRVLLTAAVLAATMAIAAGPAQAAISKGSVSLTGPGGKKIGREVSAKLSVANSNANPAVTPERLNTLYVTSHVARFNSRAHRFRRCGASIPNDGRGAACPRGSQVGSGSFSGIFGQPFAPIGMLGMLAPVSGSIKIYNYRTHSGEQARLLAVLKTRTPLAGVSINVVVTVRKSGLMTIPVPDVATMPPAIPAALPPGTRFILTKLSAKVSGRKERHGRPFLSLKSHKSIDILLQTAFE